MKKIVLAKLKNEDAETIITLDANAYTYETLLNNQFIGEDERSNIKNLLKDLLCKKAQFYEDIVNEYKLPYIANNNYYVSPVSHEIYIEIYE